MRRERAVARRSRPAHLTDGAENALSLPRLSGKRYVTDDLWRLSLPPSAFTPNQSFSVESAIAVGPVEFALGAMGAAGAGQSTDFQETASFVSNFVGGIFLVDLLGENALGSGFDSASFQILQGGNVIYSRTFTDLASADGFFSNFLIGVSLGTSPDNIEIAFDEVLSAGEGFGFSYGRRGPRRRSRAFDLGHDATWLRRPRLCGISPGKDCIGNAAMVPTPPAGRTADASRRRGCDPRPRRLGLLGGPPARAGRHSARRDKTHAGRTSARVPGKQVGLDSVLEAPRASLVDRSANVIPELSAGGWSKIGADALVARRGHLGRHHVRARHGQARSSLSRLWAEGRPKAYRFQNQSSGKMLNIVDVIHGDRRSFLAVAVCRALAPQPACRDQSVVYRYGCVPHNPVPDQDCFLPDGARFDLWMRVLVPLTVHTIGSWTSICAPSRRAFKFSSAEGSQAPSAFFTGRLLIGRGSNWISSMAE